MGRDGDKENIPVTHGDTFGEKWHVVETPRTTQVKSGLLYHGTFSGDIGRAKCQRTKQRTWKDSNDNTLFAD
jgi:hypothetical protein